MKRFFYCPVCQKWRWEARRFEPRGPLGTLEKGSHHGIRYTIWALESLERSSREEKFIGMSPEEWYRMKRKPCWVDVMDYEWD